MLLPTAGLLLEVCQNKSLSCDLDLTGACKSHLLWSQSGASRESVKTISRGAPKSVFTFHQTIASLSFLVVETGQKEAVRVNNESVDTSLITLPGGGLGYISVDVRITGMWPNLCRSISRKGVLSTTGLALGASVLYLSPITRECGCCGPTGKDLDRGVSFDTIPSTVVPHDDFDYRRVCISHCPGKVLGDRCTGCPARFRIISDLLEGINASTHRQTELQEGSPSAWETIPTRCPAVVWQLQPSNSCTPQNV